MVMIATTSASMPARRGIRNFMIKKNTGKAIESYFPLGEFTKRVRESGAKSLSDVSAQRIEYLRHFSCICKSQ